MYPALGCHDRSNGVTLPASHGLCDGVWGLLRAQLGRASGCGTGSSTRARGAGGAVAALHISESCRSGGVLPRPSIAAQTFTPRLPTRDFEVSAYGREGWVTDHCPRDPSGMRP